MRYTLALISILLLPVLGYAQNTYSFDYKLTYSRDNTSEDSNLIYYINAEDNSYQLLVKEKDSLFYKLTFTDFSKEICAVVQIGKDVLLASDQVQIGRKDMGYYKDTYAYKIKNYEYLVKKDSLRNGKKLRHIVYQKKHLDQKRSLAEESLNYLVNPSTKIKPIKNFVGTVKELKRFKNGFPEGWLKEKYFQNAQGKITSHTKLEKVERVHFEIKLVKNCGQLGITHKFMWSKKNK